MITVYGEVLFDMLPEGKRPGGAPFNVACHLAGFQLDPVFISRVGTDDEGRELRRVAESVGLSTHHLQNDPVHPTGRVQVTLSGDGVPSYHIERDAAYDHIDCETARSGIAEPIQLLYYGTLIQRSEESRECLEILEDTVQGTTFCDLNLRRDCYDRDSLQWSLSHGDVIKCSQEEFREIREIFGLPDDELKGVPSLMESFGTDILVITRGEEGSTLFTHEDRIDAETFPVTNMKDTVGAGDAFSAALIAGLLEEREHETVLRAASFLASALCEYSGALPGEDEPYTRAAEILRGNR
jgi:fructokinase